MSRPPLRPPLTSFLHKRASSASAGSSTTFGSGAGRGSWTQAGRAAVAAPSPLAGKQVDNWSDDRGDNRGDNRSDSRDGKRVDSLHGSPAGARAGNPAAFPARRAATNPAPVRSGARGAAGVLEFLRIDDKMAALLPAATRMASLQTDCAALLPEMFSSCAVLQFAEELLVLAVPNAAIAARLRQRLPKLQEGLLQRGWQVKDVRLKVQVGANVPKTVFVKQAIMPDNALDAMADLESTLEDEPRNAPLKAALAALLMRQRSQR